MGVPKQILDAEAEADKELDEVTVAGGGKPTVEVAESALANGVVQPTQVEVTEPISEQKPVVVSDGEGLIAKELVATKELQREHSAAGRLAALQGQRKADLEEWTQKEKAYKERISALEAENLGLKSVKPEPTMNESEELSEDMIKRYRAILGDDYTDDDILKFHRASQLGACAELRAIKEKLAREEEAKEKAAGEKRVNDFLAVLNEEFPGFIQMDKSNDPRLMEFYDTAVGGFVEGTFGDIAKTALNDGDYPKFSQVIKEFAKRYGIVFSPNGNPVDGRLQAQVRPSSASASRKIEKQPKVRKVPRSEISQFMRLWQAGKVKGAYGLSDSQVREYIAFYEQCEADGNVDENK